VSRRSHVRWVVASPLDRHGRVEVGKDRVCRSQPRRAGSSPPPNRGPAEGCRRRALAAIELPRRLTERRAGPPGWVALASGPRRGWRQRPRTRRSRCVAASSDPRGTVARAHRRRRCSSSVRAHSQPSSRSPPAPASIPGAGECGARSDPAHPLGQQPISDRGPRHGGRCSAVPHGSPTTSHRDAPRHPLPSRGLRCTRDVGAPGRCSRTSDPSARGGAVVEPRHRVRLARGVTVGDGRLVPDPSDHRVAPRQILARRPSPAALLVTAGAPASPIDAVRIIHNLSSGKQCSPTPRWRPAGAPRHPVTTIGRPSPRQSDIMSCRRVQMQGPAPPGPPLRERLCDRDAAASAASGKDPPRENSEGTSGSPRSCSNPPTTFPRPTSVADSPRTSAWWASRPIRTPSWPRHEKLRSQRPRPDVANDISQHDAGFEVDPTARSSSTRRSVKAPLAGETAGRDHPGGSHS